MTERADAAARALPCGRSAADLVDLAAGDAAAVSPELAEHAAGCPHCQAELARQRPAWHLVRSAAEAPVVTPPELVDRVLDSLRGLRGRTGGHAIELAEPDGTLTVSESVVVVIARALVREHAETRGDIWERGVEFGDDGLVVRIAVAYGVDIAAATDALRRHVHTGLVGHLGDAVPAVQVDVVDVVSR
jgi:uncharacterized alkaline shock family protein YloU